MSRVAISEYAAKKLLLGDAYRGVTATKETADEAVMELEEGKKYIIKIDVGIKKRGKQGLIRLNVAKGGAKAALSELFSLGHEQCVIEEMVPHETEDEQYLSIDLQREGALVLFSKVGGVEIEENSEEIQRFFIPRTEVLSADTTLEIEHVPLKDILTSMGKYHLSFLEINPFLAKDKSFLPLDLAVEIDDAKASKLPSWVEAHILKKASTPEEKAVAAQDETTAAALTLKVLNKNGSILTLLSGGGASLVAIDTLVTAGLQDKIINYSEYSGAPTRDETHAYVNTLLKTLFASNAPKKAILIAGGVANFTDILATFEGIVDAFGENIDELKRQNIYICVRRGGPNQEKGLAYLKDFLTQNGIMCAVHDPSLSLGEVATLVTPHL
jgi:succinyl-CoA synthetase beta subunit